jgi:hypothetical protein
MGRTREDDEAPLNEIRLDVWLDVVLSVVVEPPLGSRERVSRLDVDDRQVRVVRLPLDDVRLVRIFGVGFEVAQVVREPESAKTILQRQSDSVLRDCAAAGISRVWLHRGAGPGAESPQALAFCKEHGIEAVRGLCPFMALPGAGFGHRVHGWFRLRKARAS